MASSKHLVTCAGEPISMGKRLMSGSTGASSLDDEVSESSGSSGRTSGGARLGAPPLQLRSIPFSQESGCTANALESITLKLPLPRRAKDMEFQLVHDGASST
eukprot:5134448-Amphidinium_carterae.2